MPFIRSPLQRKSFAPYLQPGNIKLQWPSLRCFSQNSQLLIISPPPLRPQLPFLHGTSSLRVPGVLTHSQFHLQITRLLTTKGRKHYTDQIVLGAKWAAYIWAAFGLFCIMKFGVENEWLERLYPSPHEWTWISRWLFRNNHGQKNGFQNETGIIDWANVSSSWMHLVYRLEHPTIDGKDLQPRAREGDAITDGVSKMGLDISSMSEPWRRGYYEALFGSAQAAEHLDTWVLDKTRNLAFPPEVVIGPSNPRPKPVPFGTHNAPLEENCEPADESPEVYYMKILTTRGFSSRQRLDAALAFADWLDFKGRHSSAEDIYDWALDIAMAGLPIGVNNVVDMKTGVIDEHATYVSPNILKATKALAIYHAQNKRLSISLPIFLSILRAQRNLPPFPDPNMTPLDGTTPPLATSSISSCIVSIVKPPPSPPQPSSGDEPATRTPTTPCEDSAIMAHIGEILFSSTYHHMASSLLQSPLSIWSHIPEYFSPYHPEDPGPPGLSWTRSSVSLSESTLRSLTSSQQKTVDKTAQERCAECMLMGMQNWQTMLMMLRRDEQRERKRLQKSLAEFEAGVLAREREAGGWFWGRKDSKAQSEVGVKVEKEGMWEREEWFVLNRGRQVRRFLREEGLGRESGL